MSLGDNMNIELKSILLTRYEEEKHKTLKDELETGTSHSEFMRKIRRIQR